MRRTISKDKLTALLEEHKDFETSNGKLGSRIFDLSGVRIDGYNFSHLNFSDLIVQDSELLNCIFSSVDLSRANFDGSDLLNVTFDRSDLIKAELYECNFSDVKFINANMNRTEFTNFNLRNTTFTNVSLIGSDFDNCDISKVNFMSTEFRNTAIRSCKVSSNLQEIDGIKFE